MPSPLANEPLKKVSEPKDQETGHLKLWGYSSQEEQPWSSPPPKKSWPFYQPPPANLTWSELVSDDVNCGPAHLEGLRWGRQSYKGRIAYWRIMLYFFFLSFPKYPGFSFPSELWLLSNSSQRYLNVLSERGLQASIIRQTKRHQAQFLASHALCAIRFECPKKQAKSILLIIGDTLQRRTGNRGGRRNHSWQLHPVPNNVISRCTDLASPPENFYLPVNIVYLGGNSCELRVWID